MPTLDISDKEFKKKLEDIPTTDTKLRLENFSLNSPMISGVINSIPKHITELEISGMDPATIQGLADIMAMRTKLGGIKTIRFSDTALGFANIDQMALLISKLPKHVEEIKLSDPAKENVFKKSMRFAIGEAGKIWHSASGDFPSRGKADEDSPEKEKADKDFLKTKPMPGSSDATAYLKACLRIDPASTLTALNNSGLSQKEIKSAINAVIEELPKNIKKAIQDLPQEQQKRPNM